jgi:2-C-methyl-D-erythritol 2,4-cyclodiphosphate synthase
MPDANPAHLSVAMGVRIGVGYDSHRFAPGGPLVLGGVRIDADMHCAGHSDGDAVCHAVSDAILGAVAIGDIGALFPDTDPAHAGRDSIEMLREAARRVHAAGYAVGNVDVTVVTETPAIAAHRHAMAAALSGALHVQTSAVMVKGKTNERMGWIGHGEGLAVIAVATVVPRSTAVDRA